MLNLLIIVGIFYVVCHRRPFRGGWMGGPFMGGMGMHRRPPMGGMHHGPMGGHGGPMGGGGGRGRGPMGGGGGMFTWF